MDKITISATEVAKTDISFGQEIRLDPKLPPVVPWWAKASLGPLILVLPILCLVSIVIRIAMRNLPPRTQHGWTSFLTTLLIVSGLFTSAATAVLFSFMPLPSVASTGLSELDERSQFPHLPGTGRMSAKDVAENLKPLVAVIAPAERSWLTHKEIATASFGAGTLLQANEQGYLFITARHVLDGRERSFAKNSTRALLAMSSGTWAVAELIGRHKNLDLLLLWLPRTSGQSSFSQPLAAVHDVSEGENVFVIGHPEGLRYSLSTGIISRMDGSTIQISAPVSPGNSGGPVFDDRGDLVGIVTSMIDKHGDPNAENLNFAIRAELMTDVSNWDFFSSGRKRLLDYLAAKSTQERQSEGRN